jgi:hypothetical protein
MKTKPASERIAQMAAITSMERGHFSVIRTEPDGQGKRILIFDSARKDWYFVNTS